MVFGIQPPNCLHDIFDNVGVALAVVDTEGRAVFANHAFRALFGEIRQWSLMRVEEWVREYRAQGYRFQDSQGDEMDMDGWPIMRTLAGEPMVSDDFRVIFPNGSWKWLHTSFHRFSVLGLTGVLMIAIDETAEVELRNAAARVERLATFAAVSRGLAHDFNNILGVISSNVFLALSDEGAPESIRTRLLAISNASEKAAKLVSHLAQSARDKKPEIRPVQMNEVITDALHLVRPLIRDGISVKTELLPSLPVVLADPVEMERVLVNLIVNAVDSMPQGGELLIATEVAKGSGTVPTASQEANKSVVVSVSDTGIGIPESVQSRVFEPFFTTKEKGTGLGLSNVSSIVRQHGGNIKVQSAPAKGTRISFFLPASTCSDNGQ
jgi:signal transduction histidine kinase